MITLKRLEWGNFRSYGESNFLYLNNRTLTQLLGDNGVGKTTIPLLIQEVLYGKNIKGIRKDSLVNRYSDAPGYFITLYFSSGVHEYCIKLVRSKAKLNLTLEENGEDISSHTATATYKTISNIIGIEDFKTFCQLTYQSTTDALDFLTATDTQRKRFLISLLDLSQYLEYHEVLKAEIKSLNKRVHEIKGSITSSESWIERHSRIDLTPMELKEVPEMPSDLIDKLASLKKDLDNISSTNVKIATNNKFKKDLEKLGDISSLPKANPDPERLRKIVDKIATIRERLRVDKALVDRLDSKNTNPFCSACGQPITVEDFSVQLADTLATIRVNTIELSKTLDEEKTLQSQEKLDTKNKDIERKFKSLVAMIDEELPELSLDERELTQETFLLSKERVAIQSEINRATYHNSEAIAHNSSIEVIRHQLKEFKEEVQINKQELSSIEERLAYLTILKDAFSTNGLVSYKVESSVKVLEGEVNRYLSEFSEFRIRFKLAGEKLNVEVLDDLRNVLEIQTVSTGELGRINIATGLAIRKLLSTLTNTRLNFLFLDEIVGVLDAQGKETLFDILQKEELNTIMVAHEETHPLIPKVEIYKTDKISRLNDE